MFGIALLAISPTLATTYYVSNSTGNDANDGTSPSQAWQTLDKANKINVGPGDRVLFKRGDVWRGMLEIDAPGTKDEPVLYSHYGESGPNPLIIAAVKLDQWQRLDGDIFAAKVDDAPNHVIVRTAAGESIKLKRASTQKHPSELEANEFGWLEGKANEQLIIRYPLKRGDYVDAARWDHGIKGNGSYVTLDGIDVQVSQWANIYVRGHGKPWFIQNLSVQYGWSSNRRTPGAGVEVRSVDGTIIDNVTVRDAHGDGIYVRCTNTTVQNCTIYTVYKGYNPGGDCIQYSSARTDGFRILNNWVTQKGTDTPKGCIQQEFGNNGIVRGNVTSFGVFGIEVNGDNIIVEDNITAFPGQDRKGVDPFSAGIFISEHRGYKNVIIRNNLVFGADQNGIGLEATNGRKFPPYNRSNFTIVNNTVVGARRAGIRSTVPFSGEIKNNIFWDVGRAVDIAAIIYNEPFEMDYNLFETGGSTLIAIGNETWGSAAEHSQATGQNTHSLAGDPEFIDVQFSIPEVMTLRTPLPNFRLAEGSPAVDGGVFVGYRKDITGSRVPQGNTVDIGAYESPYFRGSPPPPVPGVEEFTALPRAQDEVRLDWVYPSDAEIAGFFLHREQDKDFKPDAANLVRPLVATPPYFDYGDLDFGVEYTYQVAASNLAGYPSPYLKVTVSTLAPPEGFIAYEPFDYQENTPLSGNDAGEGWGGAWESDGASKIKDFNIASGGISSNGGSAQFWEDHRRPLASEVSPSVEKPVWIGVVFSASHQSKRSEFILFDDERKVLTLSSSPEEKASLGGVKTRQEVTKKPMFYVLKLEPDEGGGKASLWLNPPMQGNDLGEPDAVKVYRHPLDFNAVGLSFSHSSDHKGEVDEIRIGNNFHNTYTSRVEDKIAPEAPLGLSGEADGTARILLTWQPNLESDFSHFVVLRDTVPDFEASLQKVIATDVDGPQYTDTNLPEPGTTYYYRVAAVDTMNNYSEPSDAVAVAVDAPSGTLLVYEPFMKKPGDVTDGGWKQGSQWSFGDDSGIVGGSPGLDYVETHGGKASVVGSATRELYKPVGPLPGKPLWVGFIMQERNSGRTGSLRMTNNGKEVLNATHRPNDKIEINGQKTNVESMKGYQFYLFKLVDGGKAYAWIDHKLEDAEPNEASAVATLTLPTSEIDAVQISHYPASLFSVYVDEIRMGHTFSDAYQGSRTQSEL